MSLRPDDDRKQRGSSRSRSRTRERSTSRDARGSTSKPSAPTRESRKPRFAEDAPAPATTKSVAAFDAPEAPRYEVRKPSTVNPGLSSLAAAHAVPKLDAQDSDGEPDNVPGPKPLARASTFPDRRSSTRVQMPAFPTMPQPDLPVSSPTSTPSYPTGSRFVYPQDDAPGYAIMPAADYAVPDTYHYAHPPDRYSYSNQPQYSNPPVSHTQNPQRQFSTSSVPHYVPPESRVPTAPPRSQSYSSYSTEVREAKPRENLTKQAVDRSGKSLRISTTDATLNPQGPSSARGSRPDRLSVSGDRPDIPAGAKPPASPLLEAYQGTYQQMPSPMMLPSRDVEDDHDIPPLSPLDLSDRENVVASPKSVRIAADKTDAKPQKKRVKIYDAEGDADTLAAALGHSVARPGPLIDILPELTHDQLLVLREEYKKKYKMQGRGVNIAKHIKMKTTGNFGKICFVTALGRWESESYWANFWYQSRSSSRELLIEALMGRTNADIREIKDSFRDKRYEDSLSRCMERELKADKFRTAVLMALEGKRQEETDTWPSEYRDKDVEILHRALTSREGGETAILGVVVRRSDNHLREVLRCYEQVYQENFAREALKKSNNLVGEVIAHILNGCINRPARDALLLRHAMEDITSKTRTVELRYELLMSRLIRLHWDRLHLARVKIEFRKKYGAELDEELEEVLKGEFGEFCLRLAET